MQSPVALLTVVGQRAPSLAMAPLFDAASHGEAFTANGKDAGC